jgi:hypothetical protein
MATSTSPTRPGEDAPERAQAPIRWPRPSGFSLLLVLVWAVGVFVALFVPGFIVSPNAVKAPASDVWTAFTLSIVGCCLMIGAAIVLWRRTKDTAFFVMGAVPAFTALAGACIFAAAKITGT